MKLLRLSPWLLWPSLIYSQSSKSPGDDRGKWTIPWLDPDILAHDFYVDVTVNGIKFSYVPVDTGSTAFLIAGAKLGFKSEDELIELNLEPAFHYLSSSRVYYRGYWLPSNLTFDSVAGTPILSHVPVLVVAESGKCLQYPTGESCPNSTTDRKLIGDPQMRTQYMGIGFGRWGNEQPDATVDKNSLLNVDLGSDPSLHSGYIVSKTGVVVGVRPEDLDNGWNTTELAENTNAPWTGQTEWHGTPMCISVNDSPCEDGLGTVLFDTGINYAWLGVAPALTEHLKSCVSPASCVLNNGTEVKVRVGYPGEYVTEHSFTVGDMDTTPMSTPAKVRIGKMHGDETFLNTGRYFYNKFDVLFDQLNGIVGLRDRTVVGESMPKIADADQLVLDEL